MVGVTACDDGCTGFFAELVNNFVLIAAGVFVPVVVSTRFCDELVNVFGIGILYCDAGEFTTFGFSGVGLIFDFWSWSSRPFFIMYSIRSKESLKCLGEPVELFCGLFDRLTLEKVESVENEGMSSSVLYLKLCHWILFSIRSRDFSKFNFNKPGRRYSRVTG